MEEVLTVMVIALKQFSNGDISMFKGEIREFDAETAETLIDNGLVEEYVPDVPEVGTNDKDKYLHTNAETGAKEWANVSSGGGVLVVHMDAGSGVLDKTWNEINSADVAVIVFEGIGGGMLREFVTMTEIMDGSYLVSTVNGGTGASYVSDSADGYPVHQ